MKIACPFCSFNMAADANEIIDNNNIVVATYYSCNCLNSNCPVFPFRTDLSKGHKTLSTSFAVKDIPGKKEFWIRVNIGGSISIHEMNSQNSFAIEIDKPDFNPFSYVNRIKELYQKILTYVNFS